MTATNTDLLKRKLSDPTTTIYARVPVKLRNALVEEANENARTITAQLAQVLRERYTDV